ncbi:TetR/AcrR family transcriptional regulator [Nonomuraea sp. SYSU D8015]|uniref:TetR/AcrR family transcriptional regulator n=1 Tax=Nonomuraea sp. SYSU D8015 TaxID=2593644 RepID=UPI001660F5E4|nr:TetR family transcriptional regulator [Nonomuraea sp. SYSU D8015]
MSDRPAQGLRERKKAKTRALIQREALRLFREQGYAATTVEQIAEAAEVAPSTVFRYFPTKEDLVLVDQFPPFVEALRAAPRELNPVQAVRVTMRQVLDAQTPEERADSVEREKLMLTVPELWAASLDNIRGVMATVRDELAAREGRDPGDPEIRNVTGAIMGVMWALWFDWAKDPSMEVVEAFDQALAHLDAGLPISRGDQSPG